MRAVRFRSTWSGLAALAVACLSGCVGTGGGGSSAALPPSGPPVISILSSRPEHISGGDALVEVQVNGGSSADVRVLLNGEKLATALAPTGEGRALRGIVSGLRLGPNVLKAITRDGRTAEATLINHPITGPILSGPHLSPYECRTEESGLGPATDKDCSAPVRFDYFYLPASVDRSKPVSPQMFKPLDDRSDIPADVAMVQTIEGRKTPYIVRVESGVINRAIYRLAVLDDPRTQGFSASEGWNGRLAVTFGGGAGTQYNQGANQVTSILSDLYLSRGFAFLNSTELVNQQHGNAVLQGEALMMLKEHFVETYGVPKWTVGTGGSGGAIQQLVITQIYPGLLDGLQPSLSFPDSTMNTADCGLLQNFWRSSVGSKWSQEKRTAVEGYTPGTCAAWERSFVPVMKATNAAGCALKDASLLYDPVRNPKGARCTISDMRANIYGRDPANGFARKPQDNVGIQYGLKGLQRGVLTVEEFLDLNEFIGGNDIDGNFIPQRSVGDLTALRAVYASGLLNTFGGGIANVPIIHSRPYTDLIGDIHDRHRDLTIRARIEKALGRSDHQIIWTAGPSARAAGRGVDLAAISLDVMTEWLDRIVSDPSPLSTEKVVRNKPAAAVDAYWTEDGVKIAQIAEWDVPSGYNAAYPLHSEPRLEAGAPLTNDVMKCQLRAVAFGDYGVEFTAEQKQRMNRIFPDGVCDYSKPSVGYGPIAGVYMKY